MSSIPPPPPEGTADEGQPSYTSAKDARAQGKAQKAYRKASRPWYQKKRFWLLGLIALFIIFAIATSGGDEDSTTTSPSPSPTDQVVQEDEDAAAEEEDAAAEEETDEPPADEPTEEEDAPAQEAIVVTSQELIDELESNALRAKTTYEGERVTVTGYVGNIDASGSYFALDPQPDAIIFTGVQVQLDDSHLETVSNFTQGQQTTVTGTVSSVGEIMGYSIDAETVGD